jgi:hypothetical protein
VISLLSDAGAAGAGVVTEEGVGVEDPDDAAGGVAGADVCMLAAWACAVTAQ